jgi:hypothetical protein
VKAPWEPKTLTDQNIGACSLCQATKPLRHSHLLPAGVIRLLRDEGLKNPNPYLMSLGNVGQTSSQAKQYLLCHECEQRFNRNGETWVINHCYHEDRGSFPLRDLLKTHEPILASPQGGAYDASKIPGIDIDKLVYFGTSVIWRASLRQWRIQKETYQPISIAAEVQEELRQYLLGSAPFPPNAVSMVYVSTSDVPPHTAGFPDSVGEGGIDIHRFYIPGLWFHLVLGEGLTDDHRRMCILRSPVHPISLSVLGDELVHKIAFSLYWRSKTRT